jgi:hypothetical protein
LIISSITDIKGIPLDAYLTKGHCHNAKIIINQLNNFIKYENVNKNNINSFIGDKA